MPSALSILAEINGPRTRLRDEMSGWFWIKLAALVLAIPAGLLILDLLFRWMERRDWIYYKRKRPTSSTRAVMNVFQEIVQPEIRHVWEDQKQRAAEVDEKQASDD
jgi:hypothetical protein